MNEELNKNELPKGWKYATIPEIVGEGGIFVDGDWIESKDQDQNGDVRLIQLADIGDGVFRNKSSRYLTTKRAKEINCTFLSEGDVLIARMPDPIGRACMFPLKGENKFVTAVDVAIVRASSSNVDRKFLLYSINSPKFRNSIENLQSGTTRKRISRKNLSTLEFPLPPKAVQQAIVSKIEELFSELDKGIETLRTAQQQLKIYRQSVLKWAFEGRLTTKENEWKNVRLGDVAKAVDPQPSHRTPPVVPGGVPFVSIKDFDPDEDKIDFTNARRVSSDVLQEHLNRYTLEAGDFVIGKIGTIGRPVRMVLPQSYCMSANIVLIQPRGVDATYLYYFFQSELVLKAFTAGTRATSQPAFGIQKVRELKIQLPCPTEQYQIVHEIERRFSVANKVEESIEQSLKQAEVLRQSILKMAFEGKLL